MEKKKRNISFYKAGGGVSTRINLPKEWINEMGLTTENKEVELIYDKEKQTITIKK